MRVLIFSFVSALAVFAGPAAAQEDAPKIEVVKFNWSMFRPNREIDDPDPIDTRISRLPDRDSRTNSRIYNRRDERTGEKTIEERSLDLNRAERIAVRESSAAPENFFLYELKVKNLDTKPIKSFVWEYQASREQAPQNNSARRFLCVEKIKSGSSKTLRIVSHLPPTNVVDASAPDKKSEKSFMDVVIKRVEYEDGTVWQKADWDNTGLTPDSPGVAERLKKSDCAVF